MTDTLIDRADSGEIPALPGETTQNLAAQRLRHFEERATIYGPNPAAETLIIDHRDGTPYRYAAPTFTPLGHPSPLAESYVNPDVSGEIPYAPWPPLPDPAAELLPGLVHEPADVTVPIEVRPDGFRPRHRRAVAAGWVFLAGVLAATAVYAGVSLAGWAILGAIA